MDVKSKNDFKDEIINYSVSKLSDKLHKREISACEAAEAYLARIEETEPQIRAYITVTDEKARENAIIADKILKNEGDNAPILCGVPFAVKDNITTKGIKTTCASRMLENFVPPYSAGVYEKISDMGGVLLGKTNLDEFAMGSSCEKSHFGTTKNPHDTSRSPGGSSGGSAAAVAVKSAPWAVGTDTGGSARQPASFCGVVSMKPTYGLVTRSGMVEFSSSLDTVSPITSDVYDNALVLGCMAGKDKRDMTSLDTSENYTDGISGGVRGFRIAILSGYESLCSDGCARCVRRAVKELEHLGAYFGETDVVSTDIILSAYLVISAAEASSNLSRFDGLKYGYSADGAGYEEIMKNTRTAAFGKEVKRRILTGGYALSSLDGEDYYRTAKAVQKEICRVIDELWETYDAILMPTASDVAFSIGAYNEAASDMYSSDRFTTIANITGCPAITVPSGGDGLLPYGVTLMGKHLSEKFLYRAAFALEGAVSEYLKAEACL